MIKTDENVEEMRTLVRIDHLSIRMIVGDEYGQETGT
jgi:hypothetical protein